MTRQDLISKVFAMSLCATWVLACPTLATRAAAQTSSGLNSVEGAQITGSSTTDTLWADSTAHRWKLYNNTTGPLAGR